jgi:protein-histidine N-methyltransferase
MLELKKGKESLYHLYFKTFPEAIDGLPTDFRGEELALLEGSPILTSIRRKKENMKHDYQLMRDFIPELALFSYQEFKACRNLVSSRVFGIETQIGLRTGAMVPFADMINHRTPKLSAWEYCKQRDGFVLHSMGDIDPGLELFDSYGKKCNSRFFLNYGFLEDHNDSNEYLFTLELSESTCPGYAKKIKMHSLLEYLPKLKLLCCMDYEDESLIKGMRFWLAESDDEISLLEVD